MPHVRIQDGERNRNYKRKKTIPATFSFVERQLAIADFVQKIYVCNLTMILYLFTCIVSTGIKLIIVIIINFVNLNL